MVAEAPTSGPVISPEFIGDVLGVNDPDKIRLAKTLVQALEKVDPELVPQALAHPLLDEIYQGLQAAPGLLKLYRQSKDEMDRAAILDALARILENDNSSLEVIDALQKILGSTKSPMLASLAAKALATAGEEGFLEQQRNFLASDNPADVRLAARFLGHGRYQPAVPVLMELLVADRMASIDVVVWALGEIGDPAPVPRLHAMFEKFVEVEIVAEALGKIGSRASVMRLVPMLLEGVESQRAIAAQALGRIIQANDGGLGDKATTRSVRAALEKVIDRDPSVKVRFYSLIAFGMLGGQIEPNRLITILGAKLSEKETGAMRALIRKQPARKKRGPKGRPVL